MIPSYVPSGKETCTALLEQKLGSGSDGVSKPKAHVTQHETRPHSVSLGSVKRTARSG